MFHAQVLFSECCTKNETLLIWGAARFVSRSYDLALSLKIELTVPLWTNPLLAPPLGSLGHSFLG